MAMPRWSKLYGSLDHTRATSCTGAQQANRLDVAQVARIYKGYLPQKQSTDAVCGPAQRLHGQPDAHSCHVATAAYCDDACAVQSALLGD
jgi:hypothetical protein